MVQRQADCVAGRGISALAGRGPVPRLQRAAARSGSRSISSSTAAAAAASAAPDRLVIAAPDDWHLHLRDGDAMRSVVPHSATHFRRAVVMPNLVPPVTTTEMALAYRSRIADATPKGSRFSPLMTLYLTDNTPPEEVARAHEAGVAAFKLYPAGATTNSGESSGVSEGVSE